MNIDSRELEANLVRRLAAQPDDERAWRDLIKLEWSFVYSVCFRALKGHEELAREASYEVFERLAQYQPFQDLQNEGAFRSYLATVCRNICMDYLRRLISAQKLEERLIRETLIEIEVPSAEDSLEQREYLDRVLSELNEEDRELVWRSAQGYTLEEVAEHLEISASAARVRLHRLRRRLRERFPEALE